MKEKIEIKSVEMVRRIRDQMAGILKGKSHAEIIEFFKKAGEKAREGNDRRGGTQPPAGSCG
jgi:hypothetical protein